MGTADTPHAANRPLAGLKVLENSLLGPGLVATFLSDLGADVIKVEPPAGDYVRQMTWPIVEGNSLLHLHTHRGKRSICLDLKQESALEAYREMVREADVAVSPGVGFGPGGEGFVRFALIENEQRIAQAVRNLRGCLDRLA